MAGERKQSDEQVTQASPAWLKHCDELIADLPSGLLVVDASGRAVYANLACTRILGTPESLLVGRRYDDDRLLGAMRFAERMSNEPESASPAPHPVERTLNGEEAVPRSHLVEPRPNGRRHLSLDVLPLHTDLGGIAGAALVIADETEELAIRSESEWLRRDLVQSRRDTEELLRLSDSLNAVNDAIHSTLDFTEVLRLVVTEAARTLQANGALVEMREDGRWTPQVVLGLPSSLVGTRIRAAESPHASIVLRTQESLAADLVEDPRLVNDFLRPFGARRVLCVPLLARGKAVGVLTFFATHTATFGYDQLSFASKVSATASLAMENARVYAEERHIADTLQRALLAVPPSVHGVEFQHVYRSATEAASVGGDFFDIFELPGQRVGIVVGDVSGKGVEASVLASFTRQLLKAHASGLRTPSQVMEETNGLVRNVSRPQDFVTVFLGILSLRDDTLTFCSAGHPPPVLRQDGHSRLLQDGGPILGAFTNVTYHERTVRLGRGDLIVLYTDGVIEAKRDGELFGEERLVELVDAIEEADGERLPEMLVEHVSEYARGSLRDDLVAFAVRRCG